MTSMVSLIEDVGSFISAIGELVHDEVAVGEVEKALKNIIHTLDADNFEYMATIQEQSFGTTTHATGLSFHHGLAQQVIDETLQGIQQDMHDFLTNVTKASELISITDDNSAADVKKRTELVDALKDLNNHSHENSAHHHAVNHQHRPWSTPSNSAGGQ